MRWSALVLALAGCDFSASDSTPPGSHPGQPDANVAGPDAPGTTCMRFSTLFDNCAVTFGDALTLDDPQGSYHFDTDDGSLERCDAGGESCTPLAKPLQKVVDNIDIILVQAFTLTAGTQLVVDGARPFGIAAQGAIAIGGTIDVKSGRRSKSACGASAGGGGSPSGNGGGGGGGGGMLRAGLGGGNGMVSGGGAGAAATVGPAELLGGCPGGKGGDANQGGPSGGNGGGAIYLAAGAHIDILPGGAINAGGDGGGGGNGDNGRTGGGGGGSGGMIWLESPTVDVAGVLAANGGSGGEGTSGGGNDGKDGKRGLASSSAAPGGTSNDPGGDGGDGDAANLGAKAGATVGGGGAGGGGGGGGAGIIRITGTQSGAGVVSPG